MSNTYDEFFAGGILRRRWDWGASPRMFYEFDSLGVVTSSRVFTPEENTAADARVASLQGMTQRDTLIQQLSAGVVDIQGAVDNATADAAGADSLKAGAQSIKSDATNQRTQIAGFTASATYSAAQITAIKGQLDLLAARDETFAQAFVDHFTWRKNVDLYMVKAYNALLWLARVVSGRLEN